MAECVNKVSQEDHIFEGIYYSCLFVIACLKCLLGLLALCFSKDTADPF